MKRKIYNVANDEVKDGDVAEDEVDDDEVEDDDVQGEEDDDVENNDVEEEEGDEVEDDDVEEGKCRAPGPPTARHPFCASLCSRNALGHVTTAILCGNLD